MANFENLGARFNWGDTKKRLNLDLGDVAYMLGVASAQLALDLPDDLRIKSRELLHQLKDMDEGTFYSRLNVLAGLVFDRRDGYLAIRDKIPIHP